MTDIREIMQRQSRGDETIILSRKDADDLRQFLADRESDIALGVEDLAQLRGLFVAIIGHEPREVIPWPPS